jgi:acyl carrier protein
MSDSNFEKLKEFIVEQAGVYETEVTTNARLYDDLGIYGDDAFELLVKYGKKFNVDVSKFMAADYFKGEGGIDLLIDGLARLFTGKISSSELKVLTVKILKREFWQENLTKKSLINKLRT